MANEEHLNLLKQGSTVWNTWREQHQDVKPDLREADLRGANLRGANLRGANLREANLFSADLSEADLRDAELYKANLGQTDLSETDCSKANLSEASLNEAILSRTNLSEAMLTGTLLYDAILTDANLSDADFTYAMFSGADLTGANLTGAFLSDAYLSNANLTRANLSQAFLQGASLVETNLTEAILTGCEVYGISAWNLKLEGANQNNLIITRDDEPIITIDNLMVAQFIYLLLNNSEIRNVINILTTKSVLILGRFTPERKAVLDAVREALRKKNYIPILFDFDQPSTQTVRETVRTLAHLSHFVIADLTDPSSVPLELETIVPTLPIAVQPILAASQKREFSMFSSLSKRYHWLLPIYRYDDLNSLLATLNENVLTPAEKKAEELSQEINKK